MFSLNDVDGLRNRCFVSVAVTILLFVAVYMFVGDILDDKSSALLLYNLMWVPAYFLSVVVVLGKFPLVYFNKLFLLLVSSIMSYTAQVYVLLLGKEKEVIFKNFWDIYETLGNEGRSIVKTFLLSQTQLMAESNRYLVVLLVCVACVSLVFLFNAYGVLLKDVVVRWRALNKKCDVEEG